MDIVQIAIFGSEQGQALEKSIERHDPVINTRELLRWSRGMNKVRRLHWLHTHTHTRSSIAHRPIRACAARRRSNHTNLGTAHVAIQPTECLLGDRWIVMEGCYRSIRCRVSILGATTLIQQAPCRLAVPMRSICSEMMSPVRAITIHGAAIRQMFSSTVRGRANTTIRRVHSIRRVHDYNSRMVGTYQQ